MPDLHFNTSYIDNELLPSHSSQIDANQELIQEVSQYFGEAMRLFIKLKMSGNLGNTSVVAHRAFFGCTSHHYDTEEIALYAPEETIATTPVFYSNDGEVKYESLMVRRKAPVKSGPPQYYIKFHHNQTLPVGYFDDTTREYYPIGDADFQEKGKALLQKMLQSGFLGFLQGHRNSLTSQRVRELLSRNLPRMGDTMVGDIENALQQVRTASQTPPPIE